MSLAKSHYVHATVSDLVRLGQEPNQVTPAASATTQYVDHCHGAKSIF